MPEDKYWIDSSDDFKLKTVTNNDATLVTGNYQVNFTGSADGWASGYYYNVESGVQTVLNGIYYHNINNTLLNILYPTAKNIKVKGKNIKMNFYIFSVRICLQQILSES